MKELSLDTFIECYKPICNNCTPFPKGVLKNTLGNIIWDKRDYNRISSHLKFRDIWSILEDDACYYIIPVITQSMAANLVGYIVTEISYNTNDISNLKVIINKEDSIIEEINIFD